MIYTKIITKNPNLLNKLKLTPNTKHKKLLLLLYKKDPFELIKIFTNSWLYHKYQIKLGNIILPKQLCQNLNWDQINKICKETTN